MLIHYILVSSVLFKKRTHDVMQSSKFQYQLAETSLLVQSETVSYPQVKLNHSHYRVYLAFLNTPKWSGSPFGNACKSVNMFFRLYVLLDGTIFSTNYLIAGITS